ncbi:hypothetical protein D3C76_1631660 [compost metagenome]
MPQTVSTRFRERTTRKVGIMPPLKNIVMTISTVKLLRSAMSFLDNAYAPVEVTTSEISVPSTV